MLMISLREPHMEGHNCRDHAFQACSIEPLSAAARWCEEGVVVSLKWLYGLGAAEACSLLGRFKTCRIDTLLDSHKKITEAFSHFMVKEPNVMEVARRFSWKRCRDARVPHYNWIVVYLS